MNKGQSLYELVVAIAISAIIVVGIVSLSTNSINNSTYSKNEALATTYAQEASEWLRQQRDASVTAFLTNYASTSSSTWCLDSEQPITWPNSSGSCSTGGVIFGTQFTRYVNLTVTFQSGKTQVEADVIVSWKDGKGTHQITDGTNFSDLRQR